jgi:hypothetical protein
MWVNRISVPFFIIFLSCSDLTIDGVRNVRKSKRGSKVRKNCWVSRLCTHERSSPNTLSGLSVHGHVGTHAQAHTHTRARGEEAVTRTSEPRRTLFDYREQKCANVQRREGEESEEGDVAASPVIFLPLKSSTGTP